MNKSFRIENAAKRLLDENPHLDWTYDIGEPEKENDEVWIVTFRWIPSDGSVFDGYGLIEVDEETETARFV